MRENIFYKSFQSDFGEFGLEQQFKSVYHHLKYSQFNLIKMQE